MPARLARITPVEAQSKATDVTRRSSMSRLRWPALAVCATLAITAGWTRAQEQENEQRAFIRKAIEAHGGEAALKKYPASITKFKGMIEVMGMMHEITGETSVARPDRLKVDSMMTFNNMPFQFIQVLNGKKLWISLLGKTQEVKDEKIINQARDTLAVEGGSGFLNLLDKAYELNSLGDVKVKDKAAVGIRVSRKGAQDISLFFDKKTNLLIKTEMRSIDAMSGGEFTQEKFFEDYKDVSGVKTPGRLIIHKDGNLFMNLELTETQHLEKLDDTNFAMP
jgi:hypothetical protein